jgi:hypothetical protein
MKSEKELFKQKCMKTSVQLRMWHVISKICPDPFMNNQESDNPHIFVATNN